MNAESSELVWLASSQLWQVTALIAVVGIVVRVGCQHRPHLAYALWMLVVMKCLTPPLVSSPTGLFSWAQLSRNTPAVAAGVVVADRPGFRPVPLALDGQPPPDSVSHPAALGPEIETETSSQERPVSVESLVLFAWLAGVFVVGGLGLIKWWRSVRLVNNSPSVVDGAMVACANRLARRLKVRRKVRILATPQPVGPATFGILRPTILIPNSLLAGKTAEEIEPILAHELMHIRRHDAPWGALQTVAQVLWWFHPLVWWANREGCRYRERCCDEEVLAQLGYEPVRYASCLVDVLEHKRGLVGLLASPGVRAADVTFKRLEEIMKRRGNYEVRTPRWCWGLLLVAAALVLPGGAIVIGSESTKPPQETDSKGPPTTTELPFPKGEQQDPAKTDESKNVNVQRESRSASQAERSQKLRCLFRPAVDIKVPSELTGVVKSLAKKVGSPVEKGEVLAVMRNGGGGMQHVVAGLQYQVAREMAENDVQVRYAKAAAEVAETELNEKMAANKRVPGAVPSAQIRQLRLELNRALIAVEQAVFDHKVAKLAAEVKQAEHSAVEQLRLRQQVLAPTGGEIVEMYVGEGEWLNAGDPVCRIVDLEHLRADAYMQIAHYDPASVVGRNVTIQVERSGGGTIAVQGKVIFVNPEIEGGDFAVFAVVKNRKENGRWLIQPGRPGNMELASD